MKEANNNMVALAKRRAANKRSQMLKMIMPHLSHDNGEELANAISMKNSAKFKAVWERIKKEIAGKLEHFKSHSSGFDMDEFYDVVMTSISSDSHILNGSGDLKEALRNLLTDGVIYLDGTRSLRIYKLEVRTRGRSSLNSISYDVRTEIYDSAEDSVIKSFAGVGLLAPTLLYQIIVSLAYLKKS